MMFLCSLFILVGQQGLNLAQSPHLFDDSTIFLLCTFLGLWASKGSDPRLWRTNQPWRKEADILEEYFIKCLVTDDVDAIAMKSLEDGNPQDCQPHIWLLVANPEVGNSEYVHYSGLPTPIIHRNSGYNAPQPTLISTWWSTKPT